MIAICTIWYLVVGIIGTAGWQAIQRSKRYRYQNPDEAMLVLGALLWPLPLGWQLILLIGRGIETLSYCMMIRPRMGRRTSKGPKPAR